MFFIRKTRTSSSNRCKIIYLFSPDNEIDKVKEIVKQQNIDLLITKHDKKVFSS